MGNRRKNRKAACHPNLPHYGKGLCLSCWTKKNRDEETPERREQRLSHRRKTRIPERNTEKARSRYVKWKEANPEREADLKLRANYGITLEQYNSMVMAQNGRCKICPETAPIHNGKLHVDHCHDTGTIRGLICRTCNIGLGMFKNDPNRLKRAFDYIVNLVPDRLS